MPRRQTRFVFVALVVALVILGSTAPLGRRTAAQDSTPVASPAASPMASPVASPVAPTEVPLTDVDGQEVGFATFEEESAGQVNLSVSVTGLDPGDHGIHVHETGLCEPTGDSPFSSAEGHFNPTDGMHGAPDDRAAHAGDLGNITISDDGDGEREIMTDRFTLSAGEATLFDEDGSAVLIHAGEDDLTSQPSGDSGDRIVCGVIAEAASA